ncbi:hypothetical protein QR680_010176 [Steinernema hermaphroditum]|uniref:BTB domain-containing protein n=1 Tax=Steinernema hermaphroditum TaxID=289476 RepID=A0AA39IN24_9BILA|nr:hypothetical protein QR680_010176 [Steinernema hermaphroditum]
MSSYRSKWSVIATREQLLSDNGCVTESKTIGGLKFKVEAIIAFNPPTLQVELICDTFNEKPALLYNFVYHSRLVVSVDQLRVVKKDSGSVAYVANPIGYDVYTNEVPFNYINALKIELEVRFDNFRTLDLSRYNELYADTLLNLNDDMQIWVSKNLLSFHSTYFERFFNENNTVDLHDDRGRPPNEFTLNVEFYVFLIFLYCIYGFKEPDLSLVYEPLPAIMEVPHRFECEMASQKIETNLMNMNVTKTRNLFEKADECRMFRLVERIISKMSRDEIKDLATQCALGDAYSPSTRQLVMEQMSEYF